jgi:exonuclease VII large subunit
MFSFSLFSRKSPSPPPSQSPTPSAASERSTPSPSPVVKANLEEFYREITDIVSDINTQLDDLETATSKLNPELLKLYKEAIETIKEHFRAKIGKIVADAREFKHLNRGPVIALRKSMHLTLDQLQRNMGMGKKKPMHNPLFNIQL